jgi:hypothetical protein
VRAAVFQFTVDKTQRVIRSGFPAAVMGLSVHDQHLFGDEDIECRYGTSDAWRKLGVMMSGLPVASTPGGQLGTKTKCIEHGSYV